MTTKPVATRATFSIHGLQTPEDALQLEKSLTACDGIRRVDVRWSTKNAKIEFDENVISAQGIARRVAEHVVGARLPPLSARVLLKIPSIRDDATARLPAHVLHKIRGGNARRDTKRAASSP